MVMGHGYRTGTTVLVPHVPANSTPCLKRLHYWF